MIPRLSQDTTDESTSDGPVVIHLVAYERSNSLPSPSFTNTSERHTSTPLPDGEGGGVRNRGVQPSVGSVQNTHRGERANLPLPEQHSQRVVCGIMCSLSLCGIVIL